ncbi:MAG TPA: ABC transporter substrate-binding protein [Candidatus Paceibacterota bacterium]|nr:ABC transporter substrate-binding protein [Candidatus Paceibacterota bacterium]
MSISRKKLLTVVGIATASLLATLVTTVAPANAAINCDKVIGKGYAKMKGKTVKIFTSILDPELSKYQNALKSFTACTGIKVKIEGSNQFEALLPVRVKGGNAPDIAIIPQPGLLAQMVATGKAVVAPAKTLANVNKYWSAGWKGYGSVKGKFYAAPNSANMKSLVWYSPKQFANAGYSVPTTWTGMMALADKMAAANQIAFCGGIGSGGATGWPATDWLEEVVVRQFGGKVYANWISHKIKFSAPKILAAMDTVEKWMQNPKYVGDVQAIATTTFQDAGLGIPTGSCMMLQQASFYAAQYPAGTDVSKNGDVWAFYLPGINPSVKTPVEGGGEFFAAFSKRPEVQELQNYLSTPQWAINRIKTAGSGGGWLSANSGVPLSAYKNPLDQLSAKYLADKHSTFVFDASDAMPAAVGAGTEWTQLTAWFAEGKSAADVAKAIDDSWPVS